MQNGRGENYKSVTHLHTLNSKIIILYHWRRVKTAAFYYRRHSTVLFNWLYYHTRCLLGSQSLFCCVPCIWLLRHSTTTRCNLCIVYSLSYLVYPSTSRSCASESSRIVYIMDLVSFACLFFYINCCKSLVHYWKFMLSKNVNYFSKKTNL